MSKPIKVYGHSTGPNPWKVVIVLEELGLKYDLENLEFSVIKQEPFINVNPNGRVPAIEDPNTGVVLWESAAIVEYLVDTYDTDNKLHNPANPAKYYQRQWSYFQMSGQGPYYGQKAWFTFFHPEKGLTSVTDRFANEIRRVLSVIDSHLSKTGQAYLTGNEAQYPDLLFVPWNNICNSLIGPEFDDEWKEKYPKAFEWHQKLLARPAVKKAFEIKAAAAEKK